MNSRPMSIGCCDTLVRDLEDTVPEEAVRAAGNDNLARPQREATVNDFIPLLVHRLTKEELAAATHTELHTSA
jgi:hypothetical protein